MSYTLPRHMPALDGLRGVAIVMVVLTHTAYGWPAAQSITRDTMAWPATFHLPGWLAAIASQAVHGVTLFFVVSAFTLTVQAGRRDDGLLAYAVRRIARVGPGYWLAGIGYTLAAGLVPRQWAPDGVALSDLALAAVFGSAWQGGAAVAVVPGGWSVACEIAFYAALPVALWVIAGRVSRAALLAVAAAVAVQVMDHYSVILNGGWPLTEYMHPIVQAPVFLFGIAAAMLAQRLSLPQVPGLALVLLILAVVVMPLVPIPHGLWGTIHLPFAALAAGCVALSAQHAPRLLTHPSIRRVGEVSYSMYLVHFALLAPSLMMAEWAFPADNWQTFALHLALTGVSSFGVACVTYRWVEQPCIRWAGRLLEGRRERHALYGA